MGMPWPAMGVDGIFTNRRSIQLSIGAAWRATSGGEKIEKNCGAPGYIKSIASRYRVGS